MANVQHHPVELRLLAEAHRPPVDFGRLNQQGAERAEDLSVLGFVGRPPALDRGPAGRRVGLLAFVGRRLRLRTSTSAAGSAARARPRTTASASGARVISRSSSRQCARAVSAVARAAWYARRASVTSASSSNGAQSRSGRPRGRSSSSSALSSLPSIRSVDLTGQFAHDRPLEIGQDGRGGLFEDRRPVLRGDGDGLPGLRFLALALGGEPVLPRARWCRSWRRRRTADAARVAARRTESPAGRCPCRRRNSRSRRRRPARCPSDWPAARCVRVQRLSTISSRSPRRARAPGRRRLLRNASDRPRAAGPSRSRWPPCAVVLGRDVRLEADAADRSGPG